MADSDNPNAAPTATTSESPRRVYLYTELPRRCPQCDRAFSEDRYTRLYPRRYRWSTIAVLVVLTIGSLWLLGILGLLLLGPSSLWVMRWPKKVRVHCLSCRWSRTFLVATRSPHRRTPRA